MRYPAWVPLRGKLWSVPDLAREVLPALPADLERGGVLLAAVRALHGRAERRALEERDDDLARVGGLRRILDPHLGKRRVEGQLARHARRVRIEDVRHDAALLERIPDEMRFGQVGGVVDPLQNLTETIAPHASWCTPERPDTFRYERLSPTSFVTRPVTPTEVETKLVSGMYAGMS